MKSKFIISRRSMIIGTACVWACVIIFLRLWNFCPNWVTTLLISYSFNGTRRWRFFIAFRVTDEWVCVFANGKRPQNLRRQISIIYVHMYILDWIIIIHIWQFDPLIMPLRFSSLRSLAGSFVRRPTNPRQGPVRRKSCSRSAPQQQLLVMVIGHTRVQFNHRTTVDSRLIFRPASPHGQSASDMMCPSWSWSWSWSRSWPTSQIRGHRLSNECEWVYINLYANKTDTLWPAPFSFSKNILKADFTFQ